MLTLVRTAKKGTRAHEEYLNRYLIQSECLENVSLVTMRLKMSGDLLSGELCK